MAPWGGDGCSRRRSRSPSAATSCSSSTASTCRASTRPATTRSGCCAGSASRACASATATSISAVRDRLEFELQTIREMGFADYFLIVWDFVRFAKANGISVGPGRGSAAGSIVAYALRITDLDPLRYDLLFERFLNPGRKTMPDIDIDFSVHGRERVIAVRDREVRARARGADHHVLEARGEGLGARRGARHGPALRRRRPHREARARGRQGRLRGVA